MGSVRSNVLSAAACAAVLVGSRMVLACLLPDGGANPCTPTSCIPPAPKGLASGIAATATFTPLALSTPRATPLSAPPLSAAPALRVRRDQASLGETGKQEFIDAVKALKAAPAKGTNPNATNRYDEYVLMHGNNCNHFNSGFLPWHRKLLWEFESDVRALGAQYADFTVPYWDWTKDEFPSDKVTGGDNLFMGPEGSGASHTVTAGPFRAGQWVTQEQFGGNNDLKRAFQEIEKLKTEGSVSAPAMLAKMNYTDMSKASEGSLGMHNDAHVRVGGLSPTDQPIGHLADITSGADDPIFFMRHGFIDLLWTKWEISANGSLTAFEQFGATGPAIDDLLKQFGAATNDIGFKNTLNNSVRDQLDPFNTTKLGYTYDVIPEPGHIGVIMSITSVVIARRQPRAA